MKERLQADADLLQIVLESRIVHDGNGILRDHMRNADKSVDTTGSRLRIVKRVESRKIDAVVALSMACYQSLHSLNIGYAKGDDK
jgi:phage terminase large subunit-like protein